jgi:hypothetical protein
MIRVAIAIAMLATGLATSASAESLRCRSVNGNVTCSGSGAVSCQTINGHKTCVAGNGQVVQSFGGARQGFGADVDTDELDDDAADIR